jgi:hypothetical protein
MATLATSLKQESSAQVTAMHGSHAIKFNGPWEIGRPSDPRVTVSRRACRNPFRCRNRDLPLSHKATPCWVSPRCTRRLSAPAAAQSDIKQAVPVAASYGRRFIVERDATLRARELLPHYRDFARAVEAFARELYKIGRR